MKITGTFTGWEHGSGRWDASTAGHDIFARLYMLNRARPVTLWRLIRARTGWHELDSLRSGFRNKPTLKDGAIHFDGTQEIRAYK